MSVPVHTEGEMDVATRLLAQLAEPDAAPVRMPMSWAEFLDLPSELFAEYVDGEVVVSPRASQRHAHLVTEIAATLRVLRPLRVLSEGGVHLPGRRLRGPDVMVVEGGIDDVVAHRPPILVVEVLSPSTRSEDLHRKAPEYAAAGVGQLWLVDPRARSIDVHDNVGGTWVAVLHLDDDEPAGVVAVGEDGAYGEVAVDLREVFW